MRRIRNIYRSANHRDLINILVNESKLFDTIKSLMIFAAFLGYSENKRVPLDSGNEKDDIGRQIFDNELDYLYLIALAESKDPSIFKEDNNYDIVTVFEEYSNGGLEIINGWIKQYNDFSGQRAIIQGLYSKDYIEKTEKIDLDKLTASIKF